MTATVQPTRVVGFQHRDGNCRCGCAVVAGLPGALVRDSDTPKLAELGLGYYEFTVPDHALGRRSRPKTICYELGEVETLLQRLAEVGESDSGAAAILAEAVSS